MKSVIGEKMTEIQKTGLVDRILAINKRYEGRLSETASLVGPGLSLADTVRAWGTQISLLNCQALDISEELGKDSSETGTKIRELLLQIADKGFCAPDSFKVDDATVLDCLQKSGLIGEIPEKGYATTQLGENVSETLKLISEITDDLAKLRS